MSIIDQIFWRIIMKAKGIKQGTFEKISDQILVQ
jgi:hypothetical protein